jgi:hypothetical protein
MPFTISFILILAFFLIWKKEMLHNMYVVSTNENNQQVSLSLLVPLCLLITFFGYYIYMNVWYVPVAPLFDKYAVFLTPRFMGEINRLPSGAFTQWKELSIVFPLVLLLIYSLYHYGIKKNVRFVPFLILSYIISLIIELSFTLLTHNSFTHIAMQTISINNGIWYSLHKISSLLQDKSIYEQIQYVYQVLCSNNAPYTIPGTTHPGGNFLIFGIIFKISSFLSSLSMSIISFFHMNYLLDSFLGGFAERYIPELTTKTFFGVYSKATFYYFGFKAVFWGLLVTIINTTLIPVISLIMKEVFTDKMARLGTIFLVIVPSVVFHFSAMADVFGSLFLGIGIYFLVKIIKLPVKSEKPLLFKRLNYGFFSGFALTMAAQITFGHAFPILALLIVLIIVLIIKKTNFTDISYFTIALCISPFMYFIFELIVSNGESFYISRAFFITSLVESGLKNARPFPLSYFANFLILFVMGGILFAPVIFYTLVKVSMNIKSIFQKRNITQIILKQPALYFIIYSTLIMLILLITQKTVRLETERTWHWFFVPIWCLIPIFIECTDVSIKKLFSINNNYLVGRHIGFWVLIFIQIFISFMLSMAIQDIY